MKQVVQSVRDGRLRVVDLPRPTIGPTEVLVAPHHSVVSAGTERAVRNLASASLLAKARARPDLARKVLQRARSEGVARTARSVLDRLDQDMPLGYASAGRVVEVGEWVRGVGPGDLVAAAGAGHAELQVVAGAHVVPLPTGVAPSDAAFAALGAVALNGLRLADVGPGARVVIVGLGLLGRLTARLARAGGCVVAALDVSAGAFERAEPSLDLAALDEGEPTTAAVHAWSRGRGADAVLVTAATRDPGPLARAPDLCRDRGVLVLIGDVPVELSRNDLYDKELTLRVARSYGPGRYDRSYEEDGVEYPVGHVPWSARRNLETVVDLLADRRLVVEDLITHSFPVARADEAYRVLDDPVARPLAIQLDYPEAPTPAVVPTVVSARPSDGACTALVGAGNYARATMVPALDAAGFRVTVVASAGGVSAERLADRLGARRSAVDEALTAADVDVVALATPHDTHAALTVRALEAGKHVFCEKPLALGEEDLDAVVAAWAGSARQLGVGFNRRYAEAVQRVRAALAARRSPLVLTYRVAAEPLPPEHWYRHRRQGGRLLGEACHFVDTCAAIVGSPAASVTAVAAPAGDELLLSDVFTVTLRYPDGSIATVSYTTGAAPGTPKEHLEVLGGGHAAVVDDFTRLELDGRSVRLDRPGKGHEELLARFRGAVLGGPAFDTASGLATTATMFAIVAALVGGGSVDTGPFLSRLPAAPG